MINIGKKLVFFIISILIIVLSCSETDDRGGIGVSPYSDNVEDNNPIPKFSEIIGSETEIAENIAIEGTEEGDTNAADGETIISESNKIKIALLYQKSGGSLISVAEQVQMGFEIGLEYMLGENMTLFDDERPVELVLIDTQNDPEYAKDELSKFYKDPNGILAVGATSNEVTRKLTFTAEEYSKILIIEPAYADDLTGKYWNKYIFKTSPNVYQRAASVVKAIEDFENVKAVVVTEDNDTGDFAYEVIEKVLKENNAKIIKHFSLDTENKKLTLDSGHIGEKIDFNEYFNEINESIENSGATHLIIFWDLLSKPASVAIQHTPLFIFVDSQWVQQHPNTKIITEIPPIQMLRHLGNAEGIIGSSYYYYGIADYSMTEYLIEKATEKYNIQYPDSFMCGGFTAANVIIEILKRSNGDLKTKTLISLLEGKEFETPKGYVKFREEDHQALQTMFIVELIKSDDVDINWSVPEYYGLEELFYEDTEPPIKN